MNKIEREIEKIIHIKMPADLFMELGHEGMERIKSALVPELKSLLESDEAVEVEIVYDNDAALRAGCCGYCGKIVYEEDMECKRCNTKLKWPIDKDK